MPSNSSHAESHTLTFFDPLKEDGSLGRSGLLQSFLSLFQRKSFFGEADNGAQNLESKPKSKTSGAVTYKVDQSTVSSNNDASTSESWSDASSEASTSRSFSRHARDNVLSRPSTLGLSPVYKMKGPRPGNEVEIKIRGLSTIFKDLPRKISKSNQQSLRDISQLVSSNSQSDLRQYWMPDKDCHECYECNERFTTFRRRHHCRICGHIFCSRCCYQLISGDIIGFAGMVRSCTYCYNMLMSHSKSGNRHSSPTNQYTEQDVLSDNVHSTNLLTGVLSTDSNVSSASKLQERVGRSRSLISMRGSPVEDQPSMMMLGSPGPYDVMNWTSAYDMFDATPGVRAEHRGVYEQEQVSLAKSSIQLQDLWVKITDENKGVPFRDRRIRLRKFSQSFMGSELVDWLLTNEAATARDQASIIGQALLDAEWIKHISYDRGKTFYDDDCLYQPRKSLTNSKDHDSSKLHRASLPAHLPTDRGFPLRHSSTEDISSEPNWVKEITVDDDDIISDIDEDVDNPYWETATPSSSQFLSESMLNFPEDGSASPISTPSVSSFVEIDNDKNTIKYKRRNTQDGLDLRKDMFNLKEPRFADHSLTTINAEYIRGYLSWHGAYSSNLKIAHGAGWRESDLYNSMHSSHAKQAFYTLQKMYFGHSMQFLQQLFQSNKLDKSWVDIIVPLAKRISQTVTPNCEVNIDIVHYVHIKKLLDGTPKESKLINGVVFTKNVISNAMRNRIEGPVIMLLATPLEYQRVSYKLASLDPIVRQEPEFFKNLVSRISARNPDIVVSQYGVAHQARKLLRDAGITLLINVKKTVIEKLSRCTGADIARSVDQLQNVKLGSCGRFRVQHHYDGKRSFTCSDGTLATAPPKLGDGTTNSFKTVAYFDGCKPANGCTVLIRDVPDYGNHEKADVHARNSLSRVKSVLRFLIRILYHSKLELSYIMDQQDLSSTLQMNAPKAKQSESERLETNLPLDDGESIESAADTASITRVRSSTYSSLVSDSNTVTLDQLADDDALDVAHDPSCASHWYQDGSTSVANLLNTENSSEQEAFFPTQRPGNGVLDTFHSTVLSYSPFIVPKIPYLLTEPGKASPLYQYLPKILYWSGKFTNISADQTGCGLLEQIKRHAEDLDGKNTLYDTDEVSKRNRSSTTDSYASTQAGLWRTSEYGFINDADLSNAGYSEEKHLKKESTSSFKQEVTAASYRRAAVHSSGRDNSFLSSGETAVQDMLDRLSISDISKTYVTLTPDSNSSEHRRVFVSENGTAKEGNDQAAKDSAMMRESFRWSAEKHPFLTASFTKPASSKEMRDLLADFRASGSSLEPIGPQRELTLANGESNPQSRHTNSDPVIIEEVHESPVDCLAANNHQHISVLFSSYSLQSPNAPYPCVIPWAVDIEYYRGLDITLGAFLERYCFRPSYHCTNTSCNRPMVEHVRSFVHGNACMNIVLKELSKPVPYQFILSWCWNPETKTSTELKALSEDAWSMSFAKFLEFRLETFTDEAENEWTKTDLHIPPFKSFQYFLYHDIVASFKCFEIDVYEVAFPALLITFEESTTWQKQTAQDQDKTFKTLSTYHVLLQSMNSLSKIGYESTDLIYEMMNTRRAANPFDPAVGSDQQCSDEDVPLLKSKRESHFEELAALYHEERCHLRDVADTIHMKLQSIRIGHKIEKMNTSDHKETHTTLSASQLQVLKEDEEFQQENPTYEQFEEVAAIDEKTEAELSGDLLELNCLICRLVQTWNTRMTYVAEQDRQSRKSSRPANTDLYNEQPVPLHPNVRKDCKMKPASIASTVHGLTETDGARLGKPSEDTFHFTSAASSLTGKSLEDIFRDSDESLPQSRVVDKVTRESATKGERDGSASPISIPSRILEQQHSGTGPAGKRFQKTSSSMSMKSFVSHFLSGSHSTQVPMPFPSDEHYLLSNCVFSRVVVRDGEPSSIIAYTLRSPDYVNYIAFGDPSVHSMANANGVSVEKSSSFQSPENKPTIASETDSLTESDDLQLPTVEFSNPPRSSDPSFSSSLVIPEPSNSMSSASSPIPSPPPSPSVTISPHIEVQFGDLGTKFYCKVYFANEFRVFREQVLDGCEEQYINSLSRCTRWAASGGKSGSAFHKTLDDRLVLKQMSRFELQSFLQVAPAYLDYVTNAVNNKSPTALSKILGVYRVSFRNSTTSRSFKQDVLVMENLFYKRNVKRVFDLKGSVRNRHVKTSAEATTPPSSVAYNSSSVTSLAEDHTSNKNDLVLLDENLLNIMRDHPLYVRGHAKVLINKALFDDAKFLSSHLIIDYSLLVGIDSDKGEIVVGIIDYLRTFTWDKKIEMVVKSYGMIGRQGTRAMPTVVSPEIYRSRFCEAMDRYFQVVPDRWYGMQAF